MLDNYLYFRQVPDDAYTFKCRSVSKPDDFEDDTDTPSDNKWGPAIAYGAAIEFMRFKGELEGDELISMYRYYINSIERKTIQSRPEGLRAAPRF